MFEAIGKTHKKKQVKWCSEVVILWPSCHVTSSRGVSNDLPRYLKSCEIMKGLIMRCKIYAGRKRDKQEWGVYLSIRVSCCFLLLLFHFFCHLQIISMDIQSIIEIEVKFGFYYPTAVSSVRWPLKFNKISRKSNLY